MNDNLVEALNKKLSPDFPKSGIKLQNLAMGYCAFSGQVVCSLVRDNTLFHHEPVKFFSEGA